jgi:triacylglycerol lipase
MNCAYLSLCAYKEKHEIQKEFPFANFISDDNATCFTLARDDVLYIVFRGTDSRKDILDDINIIKVPMDLENVDEHKRPKVHCGFLTQFRKLDKDIRLELKVHEDHDIVITGHSLGGAMASLASLAYAHLYPDRSIACRTYGSPRVGGKLFRKMFHEKIKDNQRYVNLDDPITMLPSPWRFKHLSKLEYINKKGQVIHHAPKDRVLRCLKEFLAYIFGKTSDSPLDDHSCEVYWKKLKCLQEEANPLSSS